MSKYILSCCTAVDMPDNYLAERNIPYACFTFRINDKEYLDDFGKSLSYEDFYSMIDKGALPTTSQINIQEFMDFFEPYVKEGYDILHISFSSGLSGTIGNAVAASEELMAMYPDRTIKIVDSLCASSGYGLFMDILYEKKESGMSFDNLSLFAESFKKNIHHWFYTTDLTHLGRSGRLSVSSCAIGNLLNLCPFMHMDAEGHLAVFSKVRGKKKAAKEAVSAMMSHCENGALYNRKCFISHSGCLEDAEYLASLLKESFPNIEGDILINDIGSIIGTHCGRGTVALFFVGDERE